MADGVVGGRGGGGVGGVGGGGGGGCCWRAVFAAASFCLASMLVNSLMCPWKYSSCWLVACPAATIFMTALSSGSVPARCASIWITGSGAGVVVAAGIGVGGFCCGFGCGFGWAGRC
jgi:hypothetical protein